MGLLRREYGISRDEALLGYDWEGVQDLIVSIPSDRLINLNRKLSEQDLRREFLLQTCDETEIEFDDEAIEAFRERRRKREADGG